MVRGRILDQIVEAISNCKEANREPIMILVNPNVYEAIRQEVSMKERIFCNTHPISGGVVRETLFGLDIVRNFSVKDFLIIDDRSWYEQKF